MSKLSNVIKAIDLNNYKIMKPNLENYDNHLYDEYKTKQAILEQAIRANRDYNHILELSRDLDSTVIQMQRK